MYRQNIEQERRVTRDINTRAEVEGQRLLGSESRRIEEESRRRYELDLSRRREEESRYENMLAHSKRDIEESRRLRADEERRL